MIIVPLKPIVLATLTLVSAVALASPYQAGDPRSQVMVDVIAGAYESCLEEAKQIVNAVESDPVERAKMIVAEGKVSSLPQFRLMDEGLADVRCQISSTWGATLTPFCKEGGHLLMCASVFTGDLIAPDIQTVNARYAAPETLWYVRGGLPSANEAVRLALQIARGMRPEENIQKHPDKGIIQAIGRIHPADSGFFHKTVLDQENAIIFISKVVEKEQSRAKGHPFYPIFEKAAKFQ